MLFRSLRGTPRDIKAMFIENPAAAGGLGGLFSTHPPLQKRIAALVMMGGRDPGPEPAPDAPRTPGPWG